MAPPVPVSPDSTPIAAPIGNPATQGTVRPAAARSSSMAWAAWRNTPQAATSSTPPSSSE